ncbi:hypothetical protein D7B12_17890 [Salmonella enterica]|nr:hypothetical protein [Salmonella enterica]
MDVSAFQQQLQTMMSGGGNAMNGSMGGTMAEFEALTKALQAGTNVQGKLTSDVANLAGGGALGVQSLDTAMKTTIQENEHFTLFNRLAQSNAINIVDEYSIQSSVGGHLGGTTNTQMGIVKAANGEYKREVGFVKFLMTLRQVGYVLNIGKNIAEPVAIEERNGALQLLTDANYLLYHGNAEASPTQYDGIVKVLEDHIKNSTASGEQVYDMQGKPLESIEPFTKIQQVVSSYGSWGQSTDVFMPYSVQNDLNMNLDPAYRWTPAGQNTPMLGGQVDAIRLSKGILRTNVDTFIQDETNPMVHVFQIKHSAKATENEGIKPDVPTATTKSDASSQFTSGRAGDYYYAVAAIAANGNGMSPASITATAVSIKAGEVVTLTIPESPKEKTETGYAIYRSRQAKTGAASNDLADMRLVKIIPRTGASTVFTDYNRDIPGTVTVPMLNMAPGADAIGWRQFQPMTKIPLPFGVGGMPVMSWFQFLFGYLRVTKPKHHGMIKNVLPRNAAWRPHINE